MTARDHHRRLDQAQPWRRWYKTARWQKLRWSILVRDKFTCRMSGCGKVETNTALLVADHKVPHRGDQRLFWNAANLHCICKGCHDSLKQRQDKSGTMPGSTMDGRPVDPAHPWNR